MAEKHEHRYCLNCQKKYKPKDWNRHSHIEHVIDQLPPDKCPRIVIEVTYIPAENRYAFRYRRCGRKLTRTHHKRHYKYICQGCKSELGQYDDIVLHLKVENDRYLRICHTHKFYTTKDYKAHMRSQHRPMKQCETCGVQLKSQSVAQHLQSKSHRLRELLDYDGIEYYCPGCEIHGGVEYVLTHCLESDEGTHKQYHDKLGQFSLKWLRG